jgi:organic hydroperoxide reductase OsmC/OhrA
VFKYSIDVEWSGNLGDGTAAYSAYSRDHMISVPGKPVLAGSSDPAFRGDASRYNPEELLVASLSACHMLWYLHLCADAGIIVTRYHDAAEGSILDKGQTCRFAEVILRPTVTMAAGGDADLAISLHEEAHRRCFVANSVNFPVRHAPVVIVQNMSPQQASSVV